MITRRLALLGAAALLPGCDTLDGILGERKTPLPGERRSVLRADPPLEADAGTDPASVVLPDPVARTDWPFSGGPANHAPGHLLLSAQPGQAWRASAGSGSGYRQRLVAGPVVGNGMVYAADAGGVVSAHAMADGGRVWRFDTTPEDEGSSDIGAGIALEGGVAYVATALAEVIALDATTGTLRWRVRMPAPARGAPTVAGGRIFVATIENQLVALSAEDGQRLWTHRGAPATTVPFGLPAPAVEGEIVVAGFSTGELTACRVADGRVVWAETLGSVANASLADILGITGLPVIDRGRVFAVGQGNTSIAVDLRSGRRLWERPLGGGNGPAVAGDFAFIVTRGGEAVAIGREDGRIRWVTELDPTPASGRRSGEPARFGPPIVAGGRIIVPSSRSQLLLLDPAGGTVQGRVTLSDGVSLPPAYADGTLFLLGDSATLMAVR
jgi:outer membrane protein assembly factor BamB